MILAYATLLLLLVTLAGILLLYRKVRRVDSETWDLKNFVRNEINFAEQRLYRQIESLHALNVLLKLSSPLPALREWAGSPDFLLELARETTMRQPTTIVECSSGASTVVAARCCQLNGRGHVFSLENGAEFAEKTRRLLHEAGLDEWATIIHAPLEPVSIFGETYHWYSLAGLPECSIDILVVDGPPGFLHPQARYPAGPLLATRLREGGLIFVDDADRENERQMIARWQQEFPDLIVETRAAEKGLALLTKPNSRP